MHPEQYCPWHEWYLPLDVISVDAAATVQEKLQAQKEAAITAALRHKQRADMLEAERQHLQHQVRSCAFHALNLCPAKHICVAKQHLP
jgi:hypothetical protein